MACYFPPKEKHNENNNNSTCCNVKVEFTVKLPREKCFNEIDIEVCNLLVICVDVLLKDIVGWMPSYGPSAELQSEFRSTLSAPPPMPELARRWP